MRENPTEPPGYPEAIHSLGSVAAPLLAGFSLTLVVYTLTATEAFRWPNLALVLIMSAVLALIGCVQCTMCARLFLAPGRQEPRLAAAHRLWAKRAQVLYNGGVLLLLAGITVALVPPGPVAPARLAAVGVGLLGLAVALLWIASALPPVGRVAARFLEPREP
jgi:MFS family permease